MNRCCVVLPTLALSALLGCSSAEAPSHPDNQPEPPGRSLFQAVTKGDAELAKSLIATGANVDFADESGTTPTMQAAALGRAKILKMLIDAKASLDARDSDGFTALAYACARAKLLASGDKQIIGVMKSFSGGSRAMMAADGDRYGMQKAAAMSDTARGSL